MNAVSRDTNDGRIYVLVRGCQPSVICVEERKVDSTLWVEEIFWEIVECLR